MKTNFRTLAACFLCAVAGYSCCKTQQQAAQESADRSAYIRHISQPGAKLVDFDFWIYEHRGNQAGYPRNFATCNE